MRDVELQRLKHLLHEKCSDALSEEAARELDELLASNPSAREEFWATLEIHAELEYALTNNATWVAAAEQAAAEQSLEKAEPAGQVGPVAHAKAWLLAFGFATAACILLVALSISSDSLRGQRSAELSQHATERAGTASEEVLGRLEPLQHDSHWSFGRAGHRDGANFHKGDTISVDHGAVALKFPSQTVATLQAPVIMQLLERDRLRLLHGQIVVNVAKGDEGFAVETAAAEVIDLGTVFSVGIEGDGTDIVVFDGEVDLRLAAHEGTSDTAEPRATKRFQAGQAVHVGYDGTLSRIVAVNQFSEVSMDSTPPGPPLITAVRDNISRDNMWSFYAIVPNGLDEDVRAYVDRHHQWNGCTPSGIPSYLRGADYVRTFCDDKITADLVLELELANPGIVYVFMDKRLKVPDWLQSRFVRMKDDIGMDESHDEPGRRAMEGPAQGINHTFSTWKLVCEQAGVVQLGPNGETTPENAARGVKKAPVAMYGIAAVPLNRENAIHHESEN